METAQGKYRSLVHLSDPSLDLNKLNDCNLSINVGFTDIQFSITSFRNQLLAIEDIRMDGVGSIRERMEAIVGIFRRREFLASKFWNRVKVSLKSSKFTLVPASIFDFSQADSYLETACVQKSSFEQTFLDEHKILELVNIYAFDKHLVGWMRKVYPPKKIKFIHQGSLFLRAIQNQPQFGKACFFLIDRGVLHAAVMEDNSPLFYNQFRVKSEEEMIKYPLTLYRGLKLDPQKIPSTFWGSVGTASEYMRKLKTIIPNLSLGPPPPSLHITSSFDKLENHRYFDLHYLNQY